MKLRLVALAVGAALAMMSVPASALTAYGVQGTSIMRLESDTANAWSVPIANLNEALVGIDYNPTDGLLYVVSNQNRIYKVPTQTLAATLLSETPFADVASFSVVAVDIDVDAQVIRILGSNGQNVRVSVATGELTSLDTPLAYAAEDSNSTAMPVIRGAANVAGAASVMYGLDTALNTLTRIGDIDGSPGAESGVVSTVGSLGTRWTSFMSDWAWKTLWDIQDAVDFGPDGTAYAWRGVTIEQLFPGIAAFPIDLTTGEAMPPVSFQLRNRVTALAVVPDDVPGHDDDADGVWNGADQCPGTPPLTEVAENGCPKPQTNVDMWGQGLWLTEKCNKKGKCSLKGTVQVYDTVNAGVKKVRVDFYLSSDETLDGADQFINTKWAKVTKNSSFSTVKFNVKRLAGAGKVLAVIDGDNAVYERREDNNVVVVD